MTRIIHAGGAYLHSAAGTFTEVLDTSRGNAAGAIPDVLAAVCIIAGSARSLTGLTDLCAIPSADDELPAGAVITVLTAAESAEHGVLSA